MAVSKHWEGIRQALLVSNCVSLVLFCLRVMATGSAQYWFLFWNLFLAWIPALAVWWLRQKLHNKRWRTPVPILLSVVWLAFLPNSFYLISDLVHLENTGDIGLLFDSVLFMSFIWNGAVAGLVSMVWVHRQLLKRWSADAAQGVMIAVIALTSFAIYLGRSLRWNTWDALLNPAGLLFDVSERFINPLAHPQAIVTTLTFFVLIGSMYLVTWNFAQLLPNKSRR